MTGTSISRGEVYLVGAGTLGLGDNDPLEVCTAAFLENFVTDKFLVRKMSALVEQAGFEVNPLRSYGDDSGQCRRQRAAR